MSFHEKKSHAWSCIILNLPINKVKKLCTMSMEDNLIKWTSLAIVRGFIFDLSGGQEELFYVNQVICMCILIVYNNHFMDISTIKNELSYFSNPL